MAQAAAAPATEEWKQQLKIPPRDTRIRTAVSGRLEGLGSRIGAA
jgi:hypothetical protein